MSAEDAIAMAETEARRMRCKHVVIACGGVFWAVPYRAADKREHLEVVKP